MKHILIVLVAILLSSLLCLCRGNHNEWDSLETEDIFQAIVYCQTMMLKKQ